MTVISTTDAMAHLRAEVEDQPLIASQLAAAEETAMQFLQRRFYANQVDLDNAKLDVDQQFKSIRETYEQAVKTANELTDKEHQQFSLQLAADNYNEARASVEAVARGMVINEAIKAACLLILGQLYENRGDFVEGQVDISNLPYGSRSLLIPYRIKMGV